MTQIILFYRINQFIFDSKKDTDMADLEIQAGLREKEQIFYIVKNYKYNDHEYYILHMKYGDKFKTIGLYGVCVSSTSLLERAFL